MRKNTGNFISMVSITVITFMLGLFFYSLPEFLLSAKGVIFAAIWIGFAAIMLAAHALNLTVRKHRSISLPDLRKELAAAGVNSKARAGILKKTGTARAVRG